MSQVSATAEHSDEYRSATPDLGVNFAEIMQKLEEINCLLAAVDVIARAAYERGVEDGRAASSC